MFSVQGEKPDRLILQGGEIIGAELNGKFEIVGGMLGKRPREDPEMDAEMASAQAAADAAQAAREAMIAADAPGLPPAARQALREAAERAVRVADELAYAAGLAAQAGGGGGGAAAGGGGGGGGGAARRRSLGDVLAVGAPRFPMFDNFYAEDVKSLRMTSRDVGSVAKEVMADRRFAPEPKLTFTYSRRYKDLRLSTFGPGLYTVRHGGIYNYTSSTLSKLRSHLLDRFARMEGGDEVEIQVTLDTIVIRAPRKYANFFYGVFWEQLEGSAYGRLVVSDPSFAPKERTFDEDSE